MAVAQPHHHQQYQQKSLHYHTIQAIPRECTGGRVSSVDKAQGRIPAVVFSQDTLNKNDPSRPASRKQLLTTERKQIHSLSKSVDPTFFCSTVFNLQIRAGSGSSVLLDSGYVLPIKVHTNQETGTILNLVFVWAEDGAELKVRLPVVFKGEEDCPGLKKASVKRSVHENTISPYGIGLRIQVSLRTTSEYLCPAEHIPSKIEVDVSKLDVGDRIFMHDIEVYPSLKLVSKNENMPLCKIVAADFEFHPKPVLA